MKRFAPLLICLSLGFTACDREELPVPPHTAGETQESSFDLGPDYRWQAFFDFGTGQFVGQNLKTEWDLGFETTADGYHIVLNSAKAMYTLPILTSDWASVTDTVGLAAGKRWDSPTGNLDSTAIGDWRATAQVVVIDRGYDWLGRHQGFRKLQVQGVDAQQFQVRIGKLDGSEDSTLIIAKDSAYNFTFFSFDNGGETVTIEPPKRDWDIYLGQYLEILPEPYLVTGVLLNPYGTSAVMDSSKTYAEIDYDHAIDLPLSEIRNVIGYAWKYYHFSSGTYRVLPEMNYILQDQAGHRYKLHFIDFYNDQGQKGSPRWEYQLL